MKFVADLHIHSKYSRATSKEMNLESLDKWAKIKGIKVMATGDFTHPAWFQEIKNKLEAAEPGLYKLKGSETGTRFLLSVEISSIYSQGGKTRRVHNLILAPSMEVAEKINIALSWQGNIKSDGRPILGISSMDLAKL
ncbi:MAG TPA: DNA helicase UvrD, partial [Candidatus Paceibacterota bacterium]|nr:DNA helicase UvrD [Candidatus Paceibacterota bacterium]